MRGGRVKLTGALLGAACLSVCIGYGAIAAAPAPTPAQMRVDAAYVAMGMGGEYRQDGGAQARDTMVTLITRGTMQQWDPGESESVADLAKPDWGTATFASFWDRSRGETRIEWQRPRAGGGTRTYTDIITDTGGYVIGNDVNGAMPRRTVQGNNNQQFHVMSSLRLRALWREQERINIVVAMHENPERISAYPAQTVAGKR